MPKLLSGRRVLVVEDEMMVLMNLEDMLAGLGCECVASAATVDQALALVGAQSFDAAILDVNLNGDMSYPVAEALAARRVPFFFSTGYDNPSHGKMHHNRPVLKKPYSDQDLLEMFRGLFPTDLDDSTT